MLRQRLKHLPQCAHVLYKTLNPVISRCCLAEDGEEKPKCISYNYFVAFSLPEMTRPCYSNKFSTISPHKINLCGRDKDTYYLG